jgi:hypothetical protein
MEVEGCGEALDRDAVDAPIADVRAPRRSAS